MDSTVGMGAPSNSSEHPGLSSPPQLLQEGISLVTPASVGPGLEQSGAWVDELYLTDEKPQILLANLAVQTW